MKKTVKFERESETKNTIRFKELPEPGTAPVINTIYLQKWFAGGAEKLVVTLDLETSPDSAQI